MQPMIEAVSLGKTYKLRVPSSPEYGMLRDTMTEWARRLIRRSLDAQPTKPKTFWAVRDLQFSINQGEVVGIIGRNGAGKSTLLKLLSRITAPTEGHARLRGRVGSLLEVGTGFHPELSGRENIFLNGAILGLSRQEIRRRFDDIVAFSGNEEFLDTPIKRYSSGMQMRLAFSIAAHLEPEIMIVDEVLAVGDAEFQTKCLGKMKDVAHSGRTVLFTSHNINAVMQLCSRVIWLEGGRLKADSDQVHSVCSQYLLGGRATLKGAYRAVEDGEFNTDYFSLNCFRVLDKYGDTLVAPAPNDVGIVVEIDLDLKRLDSALQLGIAVIDDEGRYCFWSNTTDTAEGMWPQLSLGRNVLQTVIPPRLLNAGVYRVDFMASIHRQQWLSEPLNTAPTIHFQIAGRLSDSPFWLEARPGAIAPVLPWRRVC